MTGIQVIAAVFAVGMMYQAFLHFKRQDLGPGGLAFWGVLWLGLLAITLFPGFFSGVIRVIHVARLLDLVTIGALLIMAAVLFQQQISQRRLRRAVDDLVRSLALQDLHADRPSRPEDRAGAKS